MKPKLQSEITFQSTKISLSTIFVNTMHICSKFGENPSECFIQSGSFIIFTTPHSMSVTKHFYCKYVFLLAFRVVLHKTLCQHQSTQNCLQKCLPSVYAYYWIISIFRRQKLVVLNVAVSWLRFCYISEKFQCKIPCSTFLCWYGMKQAQGNFSIFVQRYAESMSSFKISRSRLVFEISCFSTHSRLRRFKW